MIVPDESGGIACLLAFVCRLNQKLIYIASWLFVIHLRRDLTNRASFFVQEVNAGVSVFSHLHDDAIPAIRVHQRQ